MKSFQKGRTYVVSALLAALLVLAGCSVAPEYHTPDAAVPAAFKETIQTTAAETLPAGEAGTWKTAQPSDALPRGKWWTVFEDAALNDLEEQALQANQELVAAFARLKESRALAQSARAGLFPTLDAGWGVTRQQQSAASQSLPDGSDVPRQTMYRAQAGVAYEADLFGRVSASIGAAQAKSAESEALFRSVQLSLQADVAQGYFTLRGLDAESEVYAQAVSLREKARDLIEQRNAEGEISELDLARARAELATARSDAMTVQRARAVAEHRLAVLLGKAPSEFSMPAYPLKPIHLRIPAGLPSALLERRPDIAAAERAMAASNARIGVAKSAFFPSLSLTAAGGFEAATLGDLFNWSSRTFLLGPLVGTALNVPIFDGGRRSGALDNAKAVYEEDVANYRQKVLSAFREVEDSISDLRILASQTRVQTDAVTASTRAAEISRAQYAEGAIYYLDVIDAERTVLQSRRAEAQLAGIQAIASVNLIRALGGGWGDVPVVHGNAAQGYPQYAPVIKKPVQTAFGGIKTLAYTPATTKFKRVDGIQKVLSADNA